MTEVLVLFTDVGGQGGGLTTSVTFLKFLEFFITAPKYTKCVCQFLSTYLSLYLYLPVTCYISETRAPQLKLMVYAPTKSTSVILMVPLLFLNCSLLEIQVISFFIFPLFHSVFFNAGIRFLSHFISLYLSLSHCHYTRETNFFTGELLLGAVKKKLVRKFKTPVLMVGGWSSLRKKCLTEKSRCLTQTFFSYKQGSRGVP